MAGGLVHIRGSIVSDDESGTGLRMGGRVTTKDTKTHPERTVAIDAATTRALRSMRSRHVEDALACGVAYPADAYLFRGSIEGTTPRPPDRFSYDWIQVDKAVDDGDVRLHDLRHFHGTMLLARAYHCPQCVIRLGHSSVTVTDIYVDGRSEWDREAAQIMGKILDERGVTP